MTTKPSLTEGEIILYRTPAGTARIEVVYEGDTFWLNQKRLADLFGVDVRTVSYHLTAIYASGELDEAATIQRIWRVQTEGNREVSREVAFYNLDAIISVGYRINSSQATQFRKARPPWQPSREPDAAAWPPTTEAMPTRSPNTANPKQPPAIKLKSPLAPTRAPRAHLPQPATAAYRPEEPYG